MTSAGEDIWALVFWVGIGALFFASGRLRRIKRVFITDYQRGVRFVKGSFVDLLGPGVYRVFPDGQQIMIVDTRPVPIVVERIFYQDILQARSVISIGVELSVSSPYRAVTMLKDQVSDSVTVIRDTLRATVCRQIADGRKEIRNKTEEQLAAAINAALEKVGMRVSKLEVTELWSRSVLPGETKGAN